MKMSEREAYLNPLNAAMFAGEIDWQNPRLKVHVPQQDSSPQSSLTACLAEVNIAMQTKCSELRCWYRAVIKHSNV